jgi:dUTP pyrophosphatase
LTHPPVRIEIARLPGAEGLPLPIRATPGASGHDLCAAVREEVSLAPGDCTLVPTGFCIAIPAGYEGQVRPRSGLARHHGIVLPNAPGTIDCDYRGEVMVLMQNRGSEPFSIRRGDRVAQLVIAPVVVAEWSEVTDLSTTERGAGGFGHTGRATEGSS